MRLHVDADLLVYRCGFAAEKAEHYLIRKEPDSDEETVSVFQYHADLKKYVEKHKLEEGTYSVESHRVAEPVKNALYNVKSMIAGIEKAMESDDVVLYLSGPDNFRDEIATLKKYKGNRDEAHKPVHGPAIKEYMRRNWPVVTSENEEADDVVGYTHYAMWEEDPYSSVIVSIDKDLDMVPGLHYNWLHEEAYNVDPWTAAVTFWTQMLTGDSTDNIPGVPGIGKVKAAKIIAECSDERSMHDAVRALYIQSYGEFAADDAFLENGRLLWIRRRPGELWTPELLWTKPA